MSQVWGGTAFQSLISLVQYADDPMIESGCNRQLSYMEGSGVRLIVSGSRPLRGRGKHLALLLVLILLMPILTPFGGAASTLQVASDDFGVLAALDDALQDREGSADAPEVEVMALANITNMESKVRPITDADPLDEVDVGRSKVSLRNTTAPPVNHPRPYQMLMDSSTHPESFPDNLIDTLFELPDDFNDPLAIGLNSYVLYLNYTSRTGHQHEAWDYGSFTGDIIAFGDDFRPFENAIDIDGDTEPDVIVSLSLAGFLLEDQGDTWGIETSGGLLPVPEEIWLKPTFVWHVEVIDSGDALWHDMASMQVSLMKGFAYNLLENGESYALVIDSRFTQPPHDFDLRVGLERVEISITGVFNTVLDLITSLFSTGLSGEIFTITEVMAPYLIEIENPDNPGDPRQTTCQGGLEQNNEPYYNASLHHMEESQNHRCALGVGIGYVHFDSKDSNDERDVLEVAYLDAAVHPVESSNRLPEEVDIILRNDNLAANSLDTVEYFGQRETDLFLHYFEDRSNYTEPSSTAEYGNTTDAEVWLRGLPAGSMSEEEIAATFTMLGMAPDSDDLPGNVPNRLSFIIGIKNFSRDATGNGNHPNLPVNPGSPPDSLICLVGSGPVKSVEFIAYIKRYGDDDDRSRTSIMVEDLPPALILHGTFQLPAGGGLRVLYDNPNLDLFSQFIDDTLLNLVEIVLDIGAIVNGLPAAILASTGQGGGTVVAEMYSRVSLGSGNSARVSSSIGMIGLEMASSDHPVIVDTDHVMLSLDRDLETVPGRIKDEIPLVEVALSARISGVHRFKHQYDPISEVREVEINGTSRAAMDFAYMEHDGGTLEGQMQDAHFTDRPQNIRIEQTTERVLYLADDRIGTITYTASEGAQRNALRLESLPSTFEILLGDELGYSSEEPLGAIHLQITNATEPTTMSEDHIMFWMDKDVSEATLSGRLSNITHISRISPEIEGASGKEGNGQVILERSSSSRMDILLRDETSHSDPYLGFNASIRLDPLPASVGFDYPSEVSSSGLELPSLGEQEGVASLAFFIGDMVGLGRTVSDLLEALTTDLAGGGGEEQDVLLSLSLDAGEDFSLIADIEKGDMVAGEPDWVHGISLGIAKHSRLQYNFSNLPVTFVGSQRDAISNYLADGIISKGEKQGFIDRMSTIMGKDNATRLANSLEDGEIIEDEWLRMDREAMEKIGLLFEERRSWHTRLWIPSLPHKINELRFNYSRQAEIPTWEMLLDVEDWKPARSGLMIKAYGLNGYDIELEMEGLDTSKAQNTVVKTLIGSDDSNAVPRTTVDMQFSLGDNLEFVRALMLNHRVKQRVEVFVKDIPAQASLVGTIGDILLIDFEVPENLRVGKRSAEAAMLQLMTWKENRWWPATVFMRDLPGQMHLAMRPHEVFDITAPSEFQGTMTLDYTSNTDTMDLYVETSGRAVEQRADTLMLAENLAKRTVMQPTEDWGIEVSSSGNGIGKVYMRQTDVPAQPGIWIDQLEIAGENLQSATIHVHYLGLLPYVVVDDVTGGRVVATANADVDFLGTTWDAKGVLLDAQITGIFPTASTFGVNGVVSDLSILNAVTGGSASTTHIIVPDPFTSVVLTVLATFFW